MQRLQIAKNDCLPGIFQGSENNFASHVVFLHNQGKTVAWAHNPGNDKQQDFPDIQHSYLRLKKPPPQYELVKELLS